MRQAQNWNQSCPNKECKDHGQINKGNISSISTYMTGSGKGRIFPAAQPFLKQKTLFLT